MAGNGWGSLGITAKGLGSLEMAGNGREWSEISRDGREWSDMAVMYMNGQELPKITGNTRVTIPPR